MRSFERSSHPVSSPRSLSCSQSRSRSIEIAHEMCDTDNKHAAGHEILRLKSEHTCPMCNGPRVSCLRGASRLLVPHASYSRQPPAAATRRWLPRVRYYVYITTKGLLDSLAREARTWNSWRTIEIHSTLVFIAVSLKFSSTIISNYRRKSKILQNVFLYIFIGFLFYSFLFFLCFIFFILIVR